MMARRAPARTRIDGGAAPAARYHRGMSPRPVPDRPAPGALARRRFLALAALAPVAAGCAAVKVGPRAEPAAGPTPASGAPDGLATLRAFPLPPEAEPAFVFRALGARGRGP
jgi:hypothetical protein